MTTPGARPRGPQRAPSAGVGVVSQDRVDVPRGPAVRLVSRMVRSQTVYRTPLAFRGVLFGLGLLVLVAYPLSRVSGEVVLSASECLIEILALVSVRSEALRVEGRARRSLQAVVVGLCVLLFADALLTIVRALGYVVGEPPIVLDADIRAVMFAVMFACFATAPLLYAGKRWKVIASASHLSIGAVLLAAPCLHFMLVHATAVQHDPSLGLLELSTSLAALVAALVSATLILSAITAHLAMFHAGVFSLACAWVLQPERQGAVSWTFELFWAAAVIVTCATLVGDARLPDLEKRGVARSDAPRTRQQVMATGLLVTAVLVVSLLVATVRVPDFANVATFAVIAVAFMVVLAVMVSGFLHPADTEQVMPGPRTRASVVVITISHETLKAMATVFEISLDHATKVRGRRYYTRDTADGPIVLTQTPRIPNFDSLTRIVTAVSDWQPRLVIIVGAARPLRSALQSGDVVLATELVEVVDARHEGDAPAALSMRSVAIKQPLLEAVLSVPPWAPSFDPLGLPRRAVLHRGRLACERVRDLSPAEDQDLAGAGVLAVESSGFGFGELAAKQLEQIPTLMMCGIFPHSMDWSWGPRPPEVDLLASCVTHYLARPLRELIETADALREAPTDDPLAHASIFVSHRACDAWFARELRLRLQDNGATVTLDDGQLGRSTARDRAHATHVVVVASEGPEGHPWIELRDGVTADQVLLPLVLDRPARAWVKRYFQGTARFDFSTWAFVSLEHSFAQLLSALRRRWVSAPALDRRPHEREPSLTRDLDALITGFSEVLCRWLAGRIHVEFIMRVLEAELDRLVTVGRREGVLERLGVLEALLAVREGEREGNYRAVVDALEEMFALIRAVKRTTIDMKQAAQARFARELADVLAAVAHDADHARSIARRAGFPPGHLPEFKTAVTFWGDVIEQALGGRCDVELLVEEAVEQLPHNEKLRRIRDAIGSGVSQSEA